MATKPAPKKRRTAPKARKPAKRRKPSDKIGHRRTGVGAQPVAETRARMGLPAVVAHNCPKAGFMEIEAGKPCNWCGVTEFGEHVIVAEALPASPFCRFCMQPAGHHLSGCRMITKRDRVIPLGDVVRVPDAAAEIPGAPRVDQPQGFRAVPAASWWRRLIDWAKGWPWTA